MKIDPEYQSKAELNLNWNSELSKPQEKKTNIEDTFQRAVQRIKQIEGTNGVKELKELMTQIIQLRKLHYNKNTHKEDRCLKTEIILVAERLKKELNKETKEENDIIYKDCKKEVIIQEKIPNAILKERELHKRQYKQRNKKDQARKDKIVQLLTECRGIKYDMQLMGDKWQYSRGWVEILIHVIATCIFQQK